MVQRLSSIGVVFFAALAATACGSGSSGGSDDDQGDGAPTPGIEAGATADSGAFADGPVGTTDGTIADAPSSLFDGPSSLFDGPTDDAPTSLTDGPTTDSPATTIDGAPATDGAPSTDGPTGDAPSSDATAAMDGTAAMDATAIMDATAVKDAPAADAPSGDASTCRPTFASGLNVAWVNYASDVPVKSGELATFNTIFQNTAAVGGSVVRWWLHVNGTVTPGYTNGVSNNISGTNNIADIKSILDEAHKDGVSVLISLWGFNMLQGVGTQNITQTILTDNMNLLENDTDRQAYIDNYLTPLVTGLKAYPGLYGWEIFNEPEGMTTTYNGWASNLISETYIQRTVNWLAAAIHAADSSALVTNGAWTFKANATNTGNTNAYSDANLMAQGGKAGGTLDFYEVHYYADNGTTNSPFTNMESHWGLDKPVVMGEFSALATDGVTAANTYTTIFTNGYKGAWAWQYATSSGDPAGSAWPSMQQPMMNLYDADKSSVTCP